MAKTKKKGPVMKPNTEATEIITIKDKENGQVIFSGDRSHAPAVTSSQIAYDRRFGGPIKKYVSPIDLAEKCSLYFEWANCNPIYKTEMIRSGILAGRTAQLPIDRPYTQYELCQHLGISTTTWYNYLKDDDYIHFREVAEWAEDVIKNRKIQGAYVGIYHPLIASRDLGLVEKTETEQNATVSHTITGIIISED